MILKHPLDWAGHLLVCYIVTVIDGPKSGAWVGAAIEGTQTESEMKSFKWSELKKAALKWDRLADLIADGIGIYLGQLTRNLLGV